MKIPIGVSVRHIHLKKEHFEQLFGNEELNKLKDLSQPGEFASDKKLTIKGSKNQIDNVRVLGPFRNYTQVEISKTDAYALGLNPPVRESGDLEGSEKITLIGPKGTVYLEEGCIIASRHIHIRPDEVIKYNLEGINKVKVMIGNDKQSILYNVSLKISDSYALDFHIDTDDANACLVNSGDFATLLGGSDE